MLFFSGITLCEESVTSLIVQECMNRGSGYSGGSKSIHSMVNSQNSSRYFNLYKSEHPVDWCTAFHECQGLGQTLATGKEQSVQETWANISSADNDTNTYYKYAWVSSVRKDFGGDWTWVDSRLENVQNSPWSG